MALCRKSVPAQGLAATHPSRSPRAAGWSWERGADRAGQARQSGTSSEEAVKVVFLFQLFSITRGQPCLYRIITGTTTAIPIVRAAKPTVNPKKLFAPYKRSLRSAPGGGPSPWSSPGPSCLPFFCLFPVTAPYCTALAVLRWSHQPRVLHFQPHHSVFAPPKTQGGKLPQPQCEQNCCKSHPGGLRLG